MEQQKVIDAHAHIGDFGGWANVRISDDQLLSDMDRFHIEKTVVFMIPNDIVRRAVQKYPDRLIGFVWVNPNEGQKALDEVKRALGDWGFQGIKLHPLFHAFIPGDETVVPIMEQARQFHVPVLFHSGHPPFSLPWQIGEVAERFPDVPIIMGHMGHGHGLYIQGAITTARKYPNIYLETSGMPMHTKIKEAYERVGSDRVMYGSDAPFHDHSVEMQRVRVSGLDETALNRVFYENAAKLLGFLPSP
jgi:predicted TIM-barrel fold metal-dependent hydrolase